MFLSRYFSHPPTCEATSLHDLFIDSFSTSLLQQILKGSDHHITKTFKVSMINSKEITIETPNMKLCILELAMMRTGFVGGFILRVFEISMPKWFSPPPSLLSVFRMRQSMISFEAVLAYCFSFSYPSSVSKVIFCVNQFFFIFLKRNPYLIMLGE